MAKFREAPCEHYIKHGECSKGRKAEQRGICQTCDKYCPRRGYKAVGNKKRNQLREKARRYE